MKIKLIQLLFVAMTFLFATCSKEGPEGAAGPKGDTGAPGTAGLKGETGTANVIYSAWLDVAYRADTATVKGKLDTVGYYAIIPAAKLSASILNMGEIKVYLNANTPLQPVVYPLPHFDPVSGFSISSSFLLQKIILYSNDNVSTVTSSGSKYQQYRYILIPGETSGRLSSFTLWDNYDEVKDHLKLPD